MHVITLHPKQFSETCQRLAQSVLTLCPEGLDLIIAIPQGGRFVAKEVMQYLPTCHYAEIKLQRPSTRHKTDRLKKILPGLPTWLLDALRVAESYILQCKRKEVPRVELPSGTIPQGCKSVLIIDDSVDSGSTLLAVKRAIESTKPGVKIITAVVAVTTPHPLIQPNIKAINDTVLVRYHWSTDYKPTADGDN